MNNSSEISQQIMLNYTYCGPGLADFQKYYSNFHGYMSLLVCQFGCVANILNIAVLSRREMRSPTNAILTGLAVADFLVMLDYIPYACHTYLSPETRDLTDKFSYGWTTFVLFHSLFSQVCHTISICLTVILAVWRYIAVAYPQKNRDWCKMENTVLALVLAYIICPIICIPLYLAVSVQNKQELLDANGRIIENANITEGDNRTTTLYYVHFNDWALRNDGLFKTVNIWIYSVVIKIIPCIALTVLSLRLICALLETKRRRQNLMNSSVPLQSKKLAAEENGTDNNSSVEKIKANRKQKKSLKLLDKERQTDRTTRMLLAVLLLFLLTEFPQGILGLLSAILGNDFFIQCYVPLVIMFVLNYTQYLRFSSMNSDDFVSFVGIVSTIGVLAQVAVASVIVFLFKHKHFIAALDKLGEIDDKLRALNVNIYYKHWFIYVVIYCSFSLTIIPMLVQADRSVYKKILDGFSTYYPGCIRFGMLSFPLLGIAVLRERLSYINNLLEAFDDDETIFNHKKVTPTEDNSAVVTLTAVTIIHADLVDMANHISDCYAFIILLNILTSIIQLVMAIFLVYARNFKELGLLELVFPFLLYSVQMALLYLFAFFTEIESQETLTMLGHLNICYLNNKMATLRNSLLLQGLHHKLVFTVCEFFPLNCAIFLRQVNICQTVVLLLIQHYKSLTEAQAQDINNN